MSILNFSLLLIATLRSGRAQPSGTAWEASGSADVLRDMPATRPGSCPGPPFPVAPAREGPLGSVFQVGRVLDHGVRAAAMARSRPSSQIHDVQPTQGSLGGSWVPTGMFSRTLTVCGL